MFMVGLQFSLPALIAGCRDVLVAGSLQVGLTVLLVAGGAVGGLSLPTALLLGGAVAMSSTAITLKQLADLGEISSQHGRLAFGILLFQDFATLPFLVMLGAWGQDGENEPLAFLRQLMIAGLALVGAALSAVRFFVSRSPGSPARIKQISFYSQSYSSCWEQHLRVISPASARPSALSWPAWWLEKVTSVIRSSDDVRPFCDVLLGLFSSQLGWR